MRALACVAFSGDSSLLALPHDSHLLRLVRRVLCAWCLCLWCSMSTNIYDLLGEQSHKKVAPGPVRVHTNRRQRLRGGCIG